VENAIAGRAMRGISKLAMACRYNPSKEFLA
jgi:hypothetical protein